MENISDEIIPIIDAESIVLDQEPENMDVHAQSHALHGKKK